MSITKLIEDFSVSHGQPYVKNEPGVYVIFNKATGWFYIGSSLKMNGRFNGHKSRLKNKRHSNPRLQKDWDAYGEACFSFSPVLVLGSDEIRAAEDQLIEKYYGANCYNIMATIDGKAFGYGVQGDGPSMQGDYRVTVRLTDAQNETLKSLGGTIWLRRVLDESFQKNKVKK